VRSVSRQNPNKVSYTTKQINRQFTVICVEQWRSAGLQFRPDNFMYSTILFLACYFLYWHKILNINSMPAAIWMLRKWHSNLLVYYEKINSLCFQSFNWLRSHGRGLPRQPPSLSDNFIERSHVKVVSLQAKVDPIWLFRALQQQQQQQHFIYPHDT